MVFGGRGKAAQAESHKSAPVAARNGARIIAVDDDATSRAAMIAVLEEEGYCVHALSDYADWDAAWKSGVTADLLVLDIMLSEPQRGGYEILRALRKLDQHTPVVMISSRHTPSDEAFAKASKANAFVSKVQGEFNHPERGLVASVNRLLST
jgi:CheY-like chemotaxis protein